MTTQNRQQIEAQLIAKANSDPAFRQALLADPKAALEQFLGQTLPKGMTITVLEEQLGHHYLVLPPAPPSIDALPLDDLELELVGGGRTLRPVSMFCSSSNLREQRANESAIHSNAS